MKKILALAIGVLLVAMAVPALAESPIDFSGHYRLLHVNHNNYGRATSLDDWEDSESFFAHRLQIQVVFHATEDIDVTWNFRAPSWTRWGALGVGGAGDFISRAFFATIRQPWGTVQVGRLIDGSPGTVGGLATLGHELAWGPFGYTNSVFNFNDTVDGITYNHDFGNGFGLAAYYFKKTSTYPQYPDHKDEDQDTFGIEPRFTWDGGGFTLGLIYDRNMNQTIAGNGAVLFQNWGTYPGYGFGGPWSPFYDWDDLAAAFEEANQLAPNSFVDPIQLSAVVDQDYTFTINPAFTQSWGPFSIGFEAAFAWGKTRWIGTAIDLGGNYDPLIETFEVDKNGYGLYFDANYNYGAGDISFLFWLVDGTDWANDEELHDAVGLGDFSPFLVAYGYNGVGRGYEDTLNGHAFAHQNNYFSQFESVLSPGGTNQWGIGLLGNHSFTDDIQVNWGIGYFALVEPILFNSVFNEALSNVWGRNIDIANRHKDLGWEIDVGATFNLLDNLTFSTQFGYMFNGNAYDTVYINNVNGDIVWRDAKDTFAWVNYLNVSF